MEPEGIEQPVVALTELPSAETLAELAGLFHDLGFVVSACDQLLVAFSSEPSDPVMTQALWTAALVTYVRCFTTGVRTSLSEEDLAQLPLEGEVIEFHQHLKNLRDKHVAHSVNPFETVRIGAILSPEGSAEAQVEGVATLYLRHISADRQGVQQLKTLASGLGVLIAERARLQTEVVQGEAQTLDVDDLYGRERLRVNAPGPDDSAHPRS